VCVWVEWHSRSATRLPHRVVAWRTKQFCGVPCWGLMSTKRGGGAGKVGVRKGKGFHVLSRVRL
jgi:hypothetical protein